MMQRGQTYLPDGPYRAGRLTEANPTAQGWSKCLSDAEHKDSGEAENRGRLAIGTLAWVNPSTLTFRQLICTAGTRCGLFIEKQS